MQGLTPLEGCEGETSTKGLESLEADCKAYRGQGARFCKWRAALRIGDSTPSTKAIDVNAQQLAQYAAIAQVSLSQQALFNVMLSDSTTSGRFYYCRLLFEGQRVSDGCKG